MVSALRGAVSQLLERAMGVRTRGEVWQRDAGYGSGLYLPTPWIVLHQLFRRLDVRETDVFVDVGSGMGRVLLVAARQPFRRVIGVEKNLEMTAIARRNLERGRGRLACQNVELVGGDVLDWPIPDDLSVVYLFCPFPPEPLELFVQRLVASIDEHPREVRLIYNFSTTGNREAILASGRAEPVDLRVPWYLRRSFREVWMVRLLQ